MVKLLLSELKLGIWSLTLSEDPCVAPRPKPLLANAFQIAQLYCAPKKSVSAFKIASRASMKPGLHGCNRMPSVTSLNAMVLPPTAEGLNRLGFIPATWMISHVISHKAIHQISPRSCDSLGKILRYTNGFVAMLVE